MKQHLKQFLIRAIIEFAFFAAIVTICGNVVYNKVDNLLIESLKESVAQQSQSTAYTLGERFQHKLDELQTRADLLQQHAVPLDSVMDIATFGTKEGRTRGILRRDNSAITGSPLPERAAPPASSPPRWSPGSRPQVSRTPGPPPLTEAPPPIEEAPPAFVPSSADVPPPPEDPMGLSAPSRPKEQSPAALEARIIPISSVYSFSGT